MRIGLQRISLKKLVLKCKKAGATIEIYPIEKIYTIKLVRIINFNSIIKYFLKISYLFPPLNLNKLIVVLWLVIYDSTVNANEIVAKKVTTK